MTGADLSIVIPTCGRPGIEPLLRGIRNQAKPKDVEIVVVGDSYGDGFTAALEWVKMLCAAYQARYEPYDGGMHMFGQPQRNYGQSIATGKWLAYSQDDNIYVPGAMQIMLEAIRAARKPRPILFRVLTKWGFYVWDEPHLELGHVDADCIVVPRKASKLGTWQPRYEGDFDFISETVTKWGGCDWRQEVIACHESMAARYAEKPETVTA